MAPARLSRRNIEWPRTDAHATGPDVEQQLGRLTWVKARVRAASTMCLRNAGATPLA